MGFMNDWENGLRKREFLQEAGEWCLLDNIPHNASMYGALGWKDRNMKTIISNIGENPSKHK